MSMSKTKRIHIKPKKEPDIFDDDFEVIYEGELPDISIEEDDYRDVLRGLSDIDDTDYIRKNDYDKYVTEALKRSGKKEKTDSKRGWNLHLPNLAKPLASIVKAGGKALTRTVQLTLRSATLILIAIITFLLSKCFLVHSSSLGSLASIAETQDPVMTSYLLIAAALILYEVIAFFSVLCTSNRRDRKGTRYDCGRGLMSFIVIYAGSALAYMFSGPIPQSPAPLYGIGTALQVYGSLNHILLPLCIAGVISCIIRRFVR